MLAKDKGYEVKVLDLINMEKSHCYNPFVYLRSDNDIQRLVTNLFKNTTPKGSQSQDPFWDQAATMLLLALIFYLHYEAPPEEQNFPMVMDMIRAGEVREDDEGFKSTLDILFDRLEMRNPEHIALKYYKSYHSGSGKTLKSIQITLISRLEKFNLESLASITQTDELELWSLGEKKTAIFAVIPDNDSSFNFIVGMWLAVLYGVYGSDDMIVQVALSQIGNVGGEPYWSWYGFGSRVEWCACFVSWCADQCGYIETGICPKYAGCVNGVAWFKEHNQWIDGSETPSPGMIIFYDWDSPNGESGPQDGESDHTGIVEKVENGIVYTVEGNSGDACRQRQRAVGDYEILGYGVLIP